MDNPISPRARGVIYVVGIVLGALTGVAAITLSVLGLDAWQPVLAAAASAIALVTGTLARANLAQPDPGDGDQ